MTDTHMLDHARDSHSPFTVILSDTGSTVTFVHLVDATRYAARQLNGGDNRASTTFCCHGQEVGATETLYSSAPDWGDAA